MTVKCLTDSLTKTPGGSFVALSVSPSSLLLYLTSSRRIDDTAALDDDSSKKLSFYPRFLTNKVHVEYLNLIQTME